MSEPTRRRAVVQGVSLTLTMLLVTVGVILQFSVTARGEARAGVGLAIVRGDGAADPAAPDPRAVPGRADSDPAPGAQEASGRTTAADRAMRAGWSAPGARTPEPGWTARQVTTPSIHPGMQSGLTKVAGTPGPVDPEAAAPAGRRDPGRDPTLHPLPAEAPVADAARPVGSFVSSGLVALPSRTPAAPLPDTGTPAQPFEPAPAAPRPVPPADAEEPEETPEPSAGGTQLNLLGPASARVDDLITYAVVVENAQAVAHAPLRLSFDPGVLAFVEAGEGDFLSTDGAGLQFLASEADTPGLVDIALSRLGAGAGITGSGTLCTVTFRIVGNGMSSIAMSGSRLLDASSRPLGFRRNDSHVAVD